MLKNYLMIATRNLLRFTPEPDIFSLVMIFLPFLSRDKRRNG